MTRYATIPREGDFPFGREVSLGDGIWHVVATKPVCRGTTECPFMVLVHRPGCDPHPLDWWPVDSLVREAGLA